MLQLGAHVSAAGLTALCSQSAKGSGTANPASGFARLCAQTFQMDPLGMAAGRVLRSARAGGFNVMPEPGQNHPMTPYAQANLHEAVRTMLQAGLDPSIPDAMGKTVLQRAQSTRAERVIEILLARERGQDISNRSEQEAASDLTAPPVVEVTRRPQASQAAEASQDAETSQVADGGDRAPDQAIPEEVASPEEITHVGPSTNQCCEGCEDEAAVKAAAASMSKQEPEPEPEASLEMLEEVRRLEEEIRFLIALPRDLNALLGSPEFGIDGSGNGEVLNAYTHWENTLPEGRKTPTPDFSKISTGPLDLTDDKPHEPTPEEVLRRYPEGSLLPFTVSDIGPSSGAMKKTGKPVDVVSQSDLEAPALFSEPERSETKKRKARNADTAAQPNAAKGKTGSDVVSGWLRTGDPEHPRIFVTLDPNIPVSRVMPSAFAGGRAKQITSCP